MYAGLIKIIIGTSIAWIIEKSFQGIWGWYDDDVCMNYTYWWKGFLIKGWKFLRLHKAKFINTHIYSRMDIDCAMHVLKWAEELTFEKFCDRLIRDEPL